MSELHVYHDDYDWIIAESPLDARNIQAENVGDEATPESEWRQEPDDKPMTIVRDIMPWMSRNVSTSAARPAGQRGWTDGAIGSGRNLWQGAPQHGIRLGNNRPPSSNHSVAGG